MSSNNFSFADIVAKDLKDKQILHYKYLIFFVMLCMAIVLCKGIFSYRLVEINGHVIQAGQLISPLWFLICDMIAEIYGYNIAKQTIIAGFLCQFIFTVACSGLNNLPFPSSWHELHAYQVVFGDMWRVNAAVLIAFIIAGFINIRIICKWKILLQGRYFWLRSIGASGISELLFSFFATYMIQLGKQEMQIIFYMALISFLLKIVYSITLSIPANIVVFYVKQAELGHMSANRS